MAEFSFDYLDAAENMAKKGEYQSALHYYFLARNMGEDVNMEIADVYGAMGILHEAIRYYMRAYAKDNNNEEALNGLIYCYKDIDEDASYYYLERAMSLMAEADLEEYDEGDLDEMFAPEPLFTVHDRRDKSEILSVAFKKIENGEMDEARTILQSIDKDSYQYSDALLAIASIEPEADGENTISLVNKALEADPKNLRGYLFKAAYYSHKKDENNLKKCMEDMYALDFKEEDDVYKAAMCLCNYNRYDLAEKYIERKLEFTPYDRIMLILLSAAKYMKGEKQKALKIAGKVCAIYPDDIETKEFIRRIFSEGSTNLPEEMLKLRSEWIGDIKNLFLEDSSDITSPESIMKIKWLLQNDEDVYLQSAVCAFVTGMPEYDGLMNEILIDPFAQPIVKKQILLRRICDPKTKEVKFVISNVFRSLKVRHPRVEDNLKFAYYYVFIALAVTELRFESELNSAFKKLSDKYKKCEDEKKRELSVNALAAILHNLAMGGEIKTSCVYFDCEEADLQKAVNMLDLKGVIDVRF